MARDQRNYRERDRQKHNAEKRRPEQLALTWDDLIHRTDGAAMPFTFCGLKVIERPQVAEGEHCPECW